MRHLLVELDKIPWKGEVTAKLVKNSILTVEQLVRIVKMDNGVDILCKITACTKSQWDAWVEELSSLVSDSDKSLSKFDPNLLLSSDMGTYGPGQTRIDRISSQQDENPANTVNDKEESQDE